LVVIKPPSPIPPRVLLGKFENALMSPKVPKYFPFFDLLPNACAVSSITLIPFLWA